MSNRTDVLGQDLTTWTDEELQSALNYQTEMRDWSNEQKDALDELWNEKSPFLSDKAEQWLRDQLNSRKNMSDHWTQGAEAAKDELDRRTAKANLQAHIAHTLMAARGLLLERGWKQAAKELEHILHEEGIEADADTDTAWDTEEATAGAGL